jgi:tryptophan-rich sensory protein
MYNSVWYYSLNQPPFLPSATVFQIAWIALYTMLFISFVLYLTKHTEKSKILGYILFIIQIILNFVWPSIFFHFQNMNFALVILILLDITVWFTIKEFYQISKKATYFLFPYFIWIIFATYLNVGFVILN